MDRYALFFCLIVLLLLVMAVTPPAAADVTISSLSPTSGTFGKTITVTVTGTGLDANTVNKVLLYRCYSTYGTYGYLPVAITKQTSTSLTGTVVLSGGYAVNGYYDLLVYPISGAVVYKLQAFTVSGAPGTTTATTSTTTSATTRTTTVATTRVTTTAATTTTSAAASTTTSSTGGNSVFFETNPTGATISLSGNVIGTSPFTYYTDKDGSFGVVARKDGFEDYEGTVTIKYGGRTRFYALLTPLIASAASANATATVGTTETGDAASGNASSAVTTIRRSTLKIPTPLGTEDLTVTEESPASPILALAAAGIAIGLVLLRRR